MKRFVTFLAFVAVLAAIPFTAHAEEKEKPNYNDMVIHHIGNANEFHLWGNTHMPLPCILFAKDGGGLSTFMSSKFHHGANIVDGYVLDHGVVRRLKFGEGGAPAELMEGEHHLDPVPHGDHHDTDAKEEKHDESDHSDHDDHGEEKHDTELAEGDHGDTHYVVYETVVDEETKKEKEVGYVYYHGNKYEIENASVLLPGKITSFYDLSLSKNVFSMLISLVLLFFVFTRIAGAYKKRKGQAPKGMQSFFEPIILFIRDEVAKPAIGPKYEKFMPFILALFFFILFNNLIGLIPFFPGSANVTGNVGATLALALFTFIITQINGTKDYWGHIFWMPGVPLAIKPVLAIIEFIGLFTKPFTLLIRLFANITGGHIIILSLVGLIWVMGNYGASTGGTIGGFVIALPFIFAMNFLELFVAFLQAFIFALLSALYIGQAVEEHHHDEHHEAAHAH